MYCGLALLFALLRPGDADVLPRFSTYYLVAPWKFGLKPEVIASLDGKSVSVALAGIPKDEALRLIKDLESQMRAACTPAQRMS